MEDPPNLEALKAELLELGYPWPGNLDGKSKSWLEAEIAALTAKNKAPRG